MKRRSVAVLLTAACALAQAAPRLTVTTEPSGPYSVRDGEHVGSLSTDMVRAMLDRAGVDYGIELLPWKRAYTAALQRRDTCVYSTTRVPEREHQFKWVGPISHGEWVLMGRAGRKFDLRSLEDARRYRIGTYNGDARDQFLRARGFAVDTAQDELVNPRKLMLDRIDLWAASTSGTGAMLARLGYAGKIVPVLVFNRVALYLACNRAVPDALVARMNTALATMEHDGSARAIHRKYAGGDRRVRPQ